MFFDGIGQKPKNHQDKQANRTTKRKQRKMKKLMMTLALIAGTMFAVASTDVYTFKTTIKYPTVGKTAFVGASTAVSGTLTIEDDETGTNTAATLVVNVKATKATYTLVLDSETAYAVFGRKGNDCATTLKFVNEDQTEGLTELTFYGWGKLKTKKTGRCTPCGDTTQICSRVVSLSGVVGGKYICPCGGSFIGWDGSCEIGEDTVDEMAVYGQKAVFKLKTVDGKRWK